MLPEESPESLSRGSPLLLLRALPGSAFDPNDETAPDTLERSNGGVVAIVDAGGKQRPKQDRPGFREPEPAYARHDHR